MRGPRRALQAAAWHAPTSAPGRDAQGQTARLTRSIRREHAILGQHSLPGPPRPKNHVGLARSAPCKARLGRNLTAEILCRTASTRAALLLAPRLALPSPPLLPPPPASLPSSVHLMPAPACRTAVGWGLLRRAAAPAHAPSRTRRLCGSAAVRASAADAAPWDAPLVEPPPTVPFSADAVNSVAVSGTVLKDPQARGWCGEGGGGMLP